jgi:hypothetical protein
MQLLTRALKATILGLIVFLQFRLLPAGALAGTLLKRGYGS